MNDAIIFLIDLIDSIRFSTAKEIIIVCISFDLIPNMIQFLSFMVSSY